MLEKIKSYLRFWSKELPSYKAGSSHGGFKLNIDEYYSLDENKEKLREINNSKFPEIIKRRNPDKDRSIQPG